MNKKKISMLLVIVLTASYVHAPFTFGGRAGLNLTNVSIKHEVGKSEVLNTEHKLGFLVLS